MPADMEKVILKDGFFAKSFPVMETEAKLKTAALPAEVGEEIFISYLRTQE